MKYDVFGLGNALMDFLIKVDESQLVKLNLEKGCMKIVDEKEIADVEKKLASLEKKMLPGGSEANTMAGIANLGGKALFCGTIGEDCHGLAYNQKLNEIGVTTHLKKRKGTTGKVFALITPDHERTFATHFGVSLDIVKEQVAENDLINSRFFHLTGYQLEDSLLRKTTLHCMKIAKKHKVRISIDLADPALVKRNKKDITDILRRYAYVVFANEEEAKVLTGKEPEKALNIISKMAKIAVVKIGKNGSMVKHRDKVFRIPAFKVKAVDTTGAGDMYAAGFLFGLSRNFNLETCGRIASFAAAKVVSRLGARLDNSLKKEVEKIIGK
ncbi:adenosine kinase [Candidatus Woesearchaeota archaeon]|nr:adenosine kinase [Candidatus Woesearchaeota archaeon]